MSPTSNNHSAAEDDQPGENGTRAVSAREGKRLFRTPRLRLKLFESFIYSRRKRGGSAAQERLTANPLCAELTCFFFFCFDAFPLDAGLFMRWPHLQKLFSFFSL